MFKTKSFNEGIPHQRKGVGRWARNSKMKFTFGQSMNAIVSQIELTIIQKSFVPEVSSSSVCNKINLVHTHA